jgi:alpha-maltose-1-phosphate synthase
LLTIDGSLQPLLDPMPRGTVLLAHPGTQYSHQLARQLARHELLDAFWTGFALADGGFVSRVTETVAPHRVRRSIANRVVHGIAPDQLRTMPSIEWRALSRVRNGESPQRAFHDRNRLFQERIPDSAIRRASVVIGFDTSSWLIAARARAFGVPFILDRSISHPITNDSIMEAVGNQYPTWRNAIEPRLDEVLSCEREEHDLATTIVVASAFSKRSLVENGVSEAKIVVNPYGVDLQRFQPAVSRRTYKHVRFLFLGSVTARKGAPLLVDAWKRCAFDGAELLLVGPITAEDRVLIPSLPGLHVIGKLPHRELPELMQQCDVLVFPSYAEGFALVLLEALSSGMPIITTTATAGPDLITDGVEVRIISPGDVVALTLALREFSDNPGELKSMGHAARSSAERFSWDAYGDRWRHIVQSHAS